MSCSSVNVLLYINNIIITDIGTQKSYLLYCIVTSNFDACVCIIVS